MDVGAELRRAREERGLSLAVLSHITKISRAVLTAIETNDERRLPAVVFTRSFVRTYASEVGLDPDEVAPRYLAQFRPSSEETLVEPKESLPAVDEYREYLVPRWSHDRPTGPLLTTALLVVCAVGYLGFVQRRAASQEQPTATPAPGPVATSGTAEPAPAPPVSDRVSVVIQPSGPCWVAATADGRSVISRLMNEGEHLAVDATQELNIRVGDPGTFAFLINGKPGRPVGRPRAPVTIRLTPTNVRDFAAIRSF